MKKLILLLFTAIKIMPSATILELIKPYRIIENNIINTPIMLIGICGLGYAQKKVMECIQPQENENRVKTQIKLTLQNACKVLFSPAFLLPILINIKNKNEIISYKFLLKYFIINTSIHMAGNIINNKIHNECINGIIEETNKFVEKQHQEEPINIETMLSNDLKILLNRIKPTIDTIEKKNQDSINYIRNQLRISIIIPFMTIYIIKKIIFSIFFKPYSNQFEYNFKNSSQIFMYLFYKNESDYMKVPLIIKFLTFCWDTRNSFI